jgi:hypothetical protein
LRSEQAYYPILAAQVVTELVRPDLPEIALHVMAEPLTMVETS